MKGDGHPFLNERMVEIAKLGNEWETRRDDSMGGNKGPLLTREAWLKLTGRQIEAARSWKDGKTLPRGQKWKYLDSAMSADQPRIGALGSTEAVRSSPRKEESPPEKSKEKRYVTAASHVPKQSQKPAPPLPPSTARPPPPEEPPTMPPIETREQRPGRQAEDIKRQQRKRQEGGSAYNYKGWPEKRGRKEYKAKSDNAKSTYSYY